MNNEKKLDVTVSEPKDVTSMSKQDPSIATRDLEQATKPTGSEVMQVMGHLAIEAITEYVDEEHQHIDEQRRILHEQCLPHVQAVNIACDRGGSTLHSSAANFLIQQHQTNEVAHDHARSFAERLAAHDEVEHLESKIAKSFQDRSKTHVAEAQGKEQVSNEDAARIRIERIYDKAGAYLHQMLGGLRAPTNPNNVIRDDFSTGFDVGPTGTGTGTGKPSKSFSFFQGAKEYFSVFFSSSSIQSNNLPQEDSLEREHSESQESVSKPTSSSARLLWQGSVMM